MRSTSHYVKILRTAARHEGKFFPELDEAASKLALLKWENFALWVALVIVVVMLAIMTCK